jgi:hypothetical protein
MSDLLFRRERYQNTLDGADRNAFRGCGHVHRMIGKDLNQHLKTKDSSYPLPNVTRPQLLLPPDYLQAPPYIPLLRFVTLPYVKGTTCENAISADVSYDLVQGAKRGRPGQTSQPLRSYASESHKGTPTYLPSFLPSFLTHRIRVYGQY